MDINKIIMESISNTVENDDSKKTEKTIIENTTQTEESSVSTEEPGGYSPIQSAIPAAISAGLGAVALRNKLRTIEKD